MELTSLTSLTAIRESLMARAAAEAKANEHKFSAGTMGYAAALALAHNHQWGAVAEAIRDGEFPGQSEGISAEDVWAWVQAHTTPGPCGWGIAYPTVDFTPPSFAGGSVRVHGITHTTASGRTHWEVCPDTDSFSRVYVDICRPAWAGKIEARYDDRTGVLEVHAYGVVFERHWRALLRCFGYRGIGLPLEQLREVCIGAGCPEEVLAEEEEGHHG